MVMLDHVSPSSDDTAAEVDWYDVAISTPLLGLAIIDVHN
jgi:hypothetical protein